MAVPRHFVELFQFRDPGLEETPESAAYYSSQIECPRCVGPRAAWHEQPTPIDVEVVQEPSCAISGVAAKCEVVRDDLLSVLAPYLRRVHVGRCTMRSVRSSHQWHTLCATRYDCLEAHRGRLCRHEMCPECQGIRNCTYSVSGGILSKDLDDRLVYLDSRNHILVESTLAKRLQLKERFPGLRYCWRYPVIEVPLDNEVLPGDAEWDGQIKPREPIAAPE